MIRQIELERTLLQDAPTSELRDIVRTLSDFEPLNTPSELARLTAAKAILRRRGRRERRQR